MPFIEIDGLTVHYRWQNGSDAPALVFSNSLGTDFRIWDQVIELLETRLGAGCPAILCYDTRGHGLTGASPPAYSIETLGGDLAGLMDRLRIADAVIVGLSVGGQIAQQLAAARADLVRALVLSDTGSGIGTDEMWNGRIEAVRQGGIEPIADAIMERWFTPAFRAQRPAELAGWRNMLSRTPAAGYAGVCAALRDADLAAATAKLALPVLCVCGDQDGATPPDLVRALAGSIEGAAFELVPDCGHLPCIEQPERFAGLLEGFLRRNGLV